MIVATAGHVDHGKTTLIRALTGTDTDRLAEEKRRGLTIDLGFAYLSTGEDGDSEPIGFIDVPGHERFIRNMVCGVAGIDFALFIIAADDGIMPQTREHLAILDLFGIRRGMVALTKVDRVDVARIAGVTEDVAELLAETSLAGSSVLPVSAATGIGVDEVRSRLLTEARKTDQRAPAGNFRLAVDRRFAVTGAGLVVTGTAFSGRCQVGDTVRLQGGGHDWRVRGIRAQSREAGHALAGQRVALNLTGPNLSRDVVKRGDWIVAGDVPAPAAKIDARLTVLASEEKAFAHWTPVHVHLGAAETTGRVAVLGTKSIAPGGQGLAQLVLDAPLGAVAGDGFIIRDQSAKRTIGGGRVVDLYPPRRGRAQPARLAQLEALRETDHKLALRRLAEVSPAGVDVGAFAMTRNLTLAERAVLIDGFEGRLVETDGGARVFSMSAWEAIRATITATLDLWHKKHPEQIGPGEEQLLAAAKLTALSPIARAIAGALSDDGVLVRERLGLRRPGHQAGFTGPDQALWLKIKSAIEREAIRPRSLNEIAEQTGLAGRRLEDFLKTAGRHGLVHRISKTRYVTQGMLDELAGIARASAAASADGAFDARAYRDASGIGRNMTIEVLEYLDKVGVTVRRGDKRVAKEAVASSN